MDWADDFFEVPALSRPPAVEPPHPKPWEPPDDQLGQEVPLEAIIAKSEKVAVLLGRLTAYPNGFDFSLSVRSKAGHEMVAEGFHGWRRRARTRWPRILPKDVFRFGVQFADGSGATNQQIMGIGAPEQPKPPILLGGGGGGGGNRYDLSYWVWPLPPPGPLVFVTEWPAERVPLSRYAMDSELIRSAASVPRGLV